MIKKISIIFIISFVFLTALSSNLYAVSCPGWCAGICTGVCSSCGWCTTPGDFEIKNPALGDKLSALTGVGFFAALLPALITLLLVVGVIVFVFIFLTGAIQWITSGGDKAAHETAKSKLTNGLVGIVILFATFAIMIALGEFFDIDLLLINLESLRLAP
jgi:hypothetical protein